MIVGGEGHTTPVLRQLVHEEYPSIETEVLPEAAVFQRYLKEVYGCQADYLEQASTNCGNNITHLLSLLAREQVPCQSILLVQDATMQRRMDAGFRKYGPKNCLLLNYAAYEATAIFREGGLAYEEHIHGMWEPARYAELLMGEIPRLRDDASGYGPKGKGFIAHVDIPDEVQEAFEALKEDFGDDSRRADPCFASK